MDDARAKVSSKGQVTIPKPIRDAIGAAGRDVVFRLDGDRVVFAYSETDLDTPQHQPIRLAVARPPWDAVRRSRMEQRGKTPRRARTEHAPDPTIVVDLRTPAPLRGTGAKTSPS
jgi:antitoxin PrlF